MAKRSYVGGKYRSEATVIREENNVDNINVGDDSDDGGLGWDANPQEWGFNSIEEMLNARKEDRKKGALDRFGITQNASGKIELAYSVTGGIPWHELGTAASGAMNSEEALRMGGLDNWNLKKVQTCIPVTKEVQVVGGKDDGATKLDTELVPVPGSYAVVRENGGTTILGTVGERYTIFTNEESFGFLDEIIEGGCLFDVVGSIDGGKRVFITVKLQDVIQVVPNDIVEPYLVFSNSHDGTSSIMTFFSSERVCCKNTHRVALGSYKRGKQKGVSFRHTKNVKSKAAQAAQALGFAREAYAEYGKVAQALAAKELDCKPYFGTVLDLVMATEIAGVNVTGTTVKDGSVGEAIMKLRGTGVEGKKKSDLADKAFSRYISKRRELGKDLMDRYESTRNSGFNGGRLAGTAWAAYNTVSEQVDHSDLLRFRGSESSKLASRFDSLLQGKGDDIKQEAFELAMVACEN